MADVEAIRARWQPGKTSALILMAHARPDVEALLAEVDRLRAQLEEAGRGR